jgi:hypothetical protein
MYEVPHNDAVLARFNRLIQDVLNGELRRRSFRLWEADILLDIMRCKANGSSMPQVLRRYQKAVQRQMSRGPQLEPLKLSEYLDSLEVKRARLRSVPPKVRSHTRS